MMATSEPEGKPNPLASAPDAESRGDDQIEAELQREYESGKLQLHQSISQYALDLRHQAVCELNRWKESPTFPIDGIIQRHLELLRKWLTDGDTASSDKYAAALPLSLIDYLAIAVDTRNLCVPRASPLSRPASTRWRVAKYGKQLPKQFDERSFTALFFVLAKAMKRTKTSPKLSVRNSPRPAHLAIEFEVNLAELPEELPLRPLPLGTFGKAIVIEDGTYRIVRIELQRRRKG